jgi:probable HAF family extracellular repeat protein
MVKLREFLLVVTAICLAVVVAPAALGATMYTVTDLGTLGVGSAAYGINSAGQVAGVFYTPTAEHAFLFSGGTMTDLGTLGGSSSLAYGVNAAGQVVGWASPSGNTAMHAFLIAAGS